MREPGMQKQTFHERRKTSHQKGTVGAQFPDGLNAKERRARSCPPQENRQDRDNQQAQHSRKRNVDDQYSVRGHGHQDQKYARTSPRGSGGIGGKGDHRTGRGKGACQQYASSDVRAGTNRRAMYFPRDPRSYDEKGRRIGESLEPEKPVSEWTEDELAASEQQGIANWAHNPGDSDETGPDEE